MIRKARKNERESQVMKEAQIKDAVALVEFFAFLEKEIESGASWDEISVLTPLTNFRKEQDHYMGSSFEAISAFGSNGAIVHYVPSPKTKKQITTESLYLLDSGGQYLDGTTDVTRTLHFGTPTPFQIEAYTRVLKGAVDLASLKFNSGTKDIFLDIIARRPLYEAGLDYGHGTGHGVGLYLSVHEGQFFIRLMYSASQQCKSSCTYL
ncbi:UNVERIFIED_CONTAM: hypothetical protein GTU68_066011 [Idotea baltica]|nr:hypothetical protein [Idotea baltica]